MNTGISENDAIMINYSYVDGVHIFTSKDEDAKGLCVGSPNLQAAFNEIPYQLGVLFKKNLQVDNIVFKSLVPYEKLEKWAEKKRKESEKDSIDDIFIDVPTARLKFCA